MDLRQQTNTKTFRNRYPLLFRKVSTYLRAQRTERILCFGCSEGSELLDFAEQWPEATIYGWEIVPHVREKARVNTKHKKNVIVLPDVEALQALKGQCDLVTAMSVLCLWPERPGQAVYDFDQFRDVVNQLTDLLKPNRGHLMVFNSSYFVSDLKASVPLVETNVTSVPGAVAMYKWPLTLTGADEAAQGVSKYEVYSRSRGQGKCILWAHRDPTAPTAPAVPQSHERKDEEEEAIMTWSALQESTRRCRPKVVASSPTPESQEPSGPSSPLETKKPLEPATETYSTNPDGTRGDDILDVGILYYSASTNIGDYAQTLAQIHLWSFFYNPETWEVQSDTIRGCLEYFAALRPGGPHRRQKKMFRRVRMTWVDRDRLSDLRRETWVIMNGWYIHSKDWPPPKFLKGLWVAVHVAQDEVMLSPEGQAYLKSQEPIGCRDIATRERLTALGIQAYFSGCLTTTLDFGQREQSLLVDNDMRASGKRKLSGSLAEAVAHDDPRQPQVSLVTNAQLDVQATRTPDIGLQSAFDRLEVFARSWSTKTMRLHCALPSWAIGVPEVIFCSPDGLQDKNWRSRDRFGAICEGDSVELALRSALLSGRVLEALDRLLVGGQPCSVVQSCLTGTSPKVQGYGDLEDCWWTKECNHTPNELRRRQPMRIHGLERRYPGYDGALRSTPLRPFVETLSVMITTDQGFVDKAPALIRSLSHYNPRLLIRLHIMARDVTAQSQVKLLRTISQMPNVTPMWHVCTHQYAYTTPLGHVSDSCMDRLNILKIPVETEKLLYLDLDMLVQGSLEPLLSKNTGRMGIAAKSSRIPVVRNWLRREQTWAAKEGPGSKIVPVEYKYKKSFNAGCFLVDLQRLRENKFQEKVDKMVREHAWNDQIILNMYAVGQYAELDGSYNVFVGQDDEKYTGVPGLPNSWKILHFAGSKKPWTEDYEHHPIFRELWDFWVKPRDQFDRPVKG